MPATRIEKTVFISYRRASGSAWALAVAKELTHRGYDVFIDYSGIGSGDFESVIVENIKSRAHFLVLLTPSALERVAEPADWFRREIETAIQWRRNIVPIFLEGFDFSELSLPSRLTGPLAPLRRYNGLTVSAEYFDEAVERLKREFLNVAVESVVHPPSPAATQAAEEQQRLAAAAPRVTPDSLTAEQWLGRASSASTVVEEIAGYTEAIRLKPNLAVAHANRGLARTMAGDLDGAMADCERAISLANDPALSAVAHNSCANILLLRGSLDEALQGYTEAIRLDTTYPSAYSNRGNVLRLKGHFDAAQADLDDAIRLHPAYATAHYNRAALKRDRGDHAGAIADFQRYLELRGATPRVSDAAHVEEMMAWHWSERGFQTSDHDEAVRSYSEVIRLRPNDPYGYYNRGLARKAKGDLLNAVIDFDEALRINADLASAYIARGNSRRLLGDAVTALADYDRALEIEPTNALALFNRASLRMETRDSDGAIADLERYLQLDQNINEERRQTVLQDIQRIRHSNSTPVPADALDKNP